MALKANCRFVRSWQGKHLSAAKSCKTLHETPLSMTALKDQWPALALEIET